VWRYPDLTQHVSYLADIVNRTIRDRMRDDARALRSHLRAREAIKEIIEMPNAQADRIIRSIEVNRGAPSNALAKEIPTLFPPRASGGNP